ncbi:class I SAM-dependent methyltransferase [Bartonella taylorii]|uniref:class I SAM-dependent methyltransferase n=1 Tax=Bartonella taylorii TaxID=33046 RepID=UPI001ABAC060|nr:class I SAM-dependent methyltransferase [Bartonella taylorii]USP00795.1 class I SAM-dependent methyltransferase [Bartonella taylorii]
MCEVQCQAVGIDISAESIGIRSEQAIMQGMVKFHVGNAERMFYPENTFTHITAG